jgi:hypothetical protein
MLMQQFLLRDSLEALVVVSLALLQCSLVLLAGLIESTGAGSAFFTLLKNTLNKL